MRARPLLAALGCLLTVGAAAPATHAKGIEQVLACGAAGCTDVTDRLGVGTNDHTHVILGTGPRAPPPTETYVAHLQIGLSDGSGSVSHMFSMAYAPRANRLRSLDENGRSAWFEVGAKQRAALRLATDDLRLVPLSAVPPTTQPRRVARVTEELMPTALIPPAPPSRGDEAQGTPNGLLAGAAAVLVLIASAVAVPRFRPRRGPRPSGAA